MFISISTLLLVSTCFSVTFVHLFLHAYLSTSRFHYETSRRFILKPTRVIRWLFLVIAFPLLPEDLKILFTLKIDFSRSQRFPIDYLQLAVNNEHGTLWRNIDLSELSNVSRWRDGWKKSPVDMTNVVPFRDKSYDTRIDFDIPVGNKKKKKTRKKGRVHSLDFTHFATNSVNEGNRIEPEGNRWQSATNLTKSSSSTGCVSRADSWRKETGDEWHAATWGDIRTWRASNTSPFSFSLSHIR